MNRNVNIRQKASKTQTLIDHTIEKGILFLLIFTPLAFGAVQPWSIAVLEIVAFSLFFLVLWQKSRETDAFKWNFSHPLALTAALFLILAGVILFQLIPLPEFLLKRLSPASLAAWRDFGNAPAGAFHPVSINPYATTQKLILLLSYAAVFFIIVHHYRTKEQVYRLVKTILYMGVFLVIFALIQKALWNGRIYWLYPLDESQRSALKIWGPFINRNHFAGYLEMVVPLVMALILYRASHVKSLPGAPFGRRLARFFESRELIPISLLSLTMIVMAACIFMTFSRGGVIGFVVSALLFAWMSSQRRTLRNRAGLIALLAIVIFSSVVLAAWDRIEKRFEDLERDHISRRDVWQDSVGIVRDYPLFGTGFGTFASAYVPYQTKMTGMRFDHAHNDYVEALTDVGLAGMLPGVGMIAALIWTLARRWRMKHSMFGKCLGAGGLAACAAIGVHSFTDFNLHIPANALLLTVICAISYVSLFHVSHEHSHRS